MRNPTTYGEFTCLDENEQGCKWYGTCWELSTPEADASCPVCDSDVYENCPFCGDEFDMDIRVHCGEQI